MNEKEMNAAEDLAYIKQIITDSKNIIIHNGMGFIIWGICITIALVITYIHIVSRIYLYINYVWILLVAIGFGFSIWENLRKIRKARVSTFVGKLTGAVWFSSAISILIIGFVAPLFHVYHQVYISPLVCLILAIGYFLTGFLLQQYWISILSIFWWLGAVVIFIFPTKESLLVMAVMMLFLQTIPGIILYIKSRKETKSEA
ncbi:MAG: hypothetical protein V1720_06290 [bacterium]